MIGVCGGLPTSVLYRCDCPGILTAKQQLGYAKHPTITALISPMIGFKVYRFEIEFEKSVRYPDLENNLLEIIDAINFSSLFLSRFFHSCTRRSEPLLLRRGYCFFLFSCQVI